MRIGFLKTDALKPEFVAKYGEYPDMFARRLGRLWPELTFNTYDVQKLEYPHHIDDADVYVITGSKASVYDEAIWITQLGNFVRELHRQKKPLLGVCFGHQMVAHALGGLTKKADTGWQVGVKTTRLLPAARSIGIEAETYQLIYSHQDQVLQPANGAEILACTPGCPIAMTRLDNHIFTVQGHPEFEKAFARDLFEFRKQTLDNSICNLAIDSLAQPTDNDNILRWALRFLKPDQ